MDPLLSAPITCAAVVSRSAPGYSAATLDSTAAASHLKHRKIFFFFLQRESIHRDKDSSDVHRWSKIRTVLHSDYKGVVLCMQRGMFIHREKCHEGKWTTSHHDKTQNRTWLHHKPFIQCLQKEYFVYRVFRIRQFYNQWRGCEQYLDKILQICCLKDKMHRHIFKDPDSPLHITPQ